MGTEIVDEAVRTAPAPPLRGLVDWYSGYRQHGVPPSRHRGLPSPWLTLILTLDEPLSMAAHPDPGAAVGDYPTLLGGLHSRTRAGSTASWRRAAGPRPTSGRSTWPAPCPRGSWSLTSPASVQSA